MTRMFGRRQLDPARPRLRHPDRGRLQLVPHPVPDHLVADRLLRGRRAGLERVRARGGRRAAVLPLDPAARAGARVVAIRNGIPILGIDLWMFGGVAKLGRDADSPGVEFRIAAAGPVVTVLIAAVCLGLGAIVSAGRTRSRARSSATTSGADDGGARLPRVDQHPAARLQPDPGLPARRRAHRAGDRVEAHRRPQQGHPLRGPARARRRLAMVACGVSLFAQGDSSAASGSPSSAASWPAPRARPRCRRTSPGGSSTSGWRT